jgi:SHS2 domain-containing protein
MLTWYVKIGKYGMIQDFENIPHTADLQLRIYGRTKKELFKHALIGMFQSIHPVVAGTHIINDRIVGATLTVSHDVHIQSVDDESLLVDFLSEALYLSDVHNEAYLDVDIHTYTDVMLTATLRGVPVQGFSVEIKAVTYHDLSIQKIDDIWQTDVVFDI